MRRNVRAVVSRVALVGLAIVCAGPLAAPVASSAATTPTELGINLNFADYAAVTDSFIASQSAAYASYISGTLRANTVTVSIPFWTTSVRSNAVTTGVDPVSGHASTPTVGRLDILLRALTGAGLRVRLRPTINEQALERQGTWRGKLNPRKLSKWFASYRAAIEPYADLAQRDHLQSFVVQTELQSLGRDPHWTGLIRDLAGRFSGELVWDSTWGISGGGGYTAMPGTSLSLDAYPALPLGASATVAQIVQGWAAFFARNPLPSPPSATVLQEVGILAATKMYRHPYLHTPPAGAAFSSRTQVRWFTAACQFAKRFGFKGISFNSLYLVAPVPTIDDPTHPEYLQPAGLASVARCFTS